LRPLLLVVALAAVVVFFIPPVLTEAHRYEFVETFQFDLAAFALPALVVLGWPLSVVRGAVGARYRDRALRLTELRRRNTSPWRGVGFAAIDVALLVAWRTPPLMDALERHRWLLVVELLSLAAGGVSVWLELVSCPPLEPRLSHPWRAVVGALTMWSVWVTAYAIGFSGTSWYVAFHHGAGGLGTTADQELSTGVLWFGATVAFVPVVFTQVLAWLRNGEDPDAELRAMVRRERWLRRPD
jgi:cytochrome c oxidase assembly factor CtaG